MLSGTPVITTDHGAYSETVVNGVNGYRCRTLKDFMSAVDAVQDLDRGVIARNAAAKYSLEQGSWMYGEYFNRLSSLYGAGWYQL